MRAVSALRSIQADSLDEPEPEGRAARPVIHQSSDELSEAVQVCSLSERELLGGLDGEVVDSGLHDRPPLCSKQGRLPP